MITKTALSAFAALCMLNNLAAQPGTLDATFGNGGIKILQPSTSHDVGHEVIALADTTLLVCGVAFVNGEPLAFLTHLLQNGAVDAAFGTNGYTYFDSGLETYAYDMELAADGSIFLCGTAYPSYPQQKVILMHALSDGTPDAAFGTNGMVITATGSADAEAQDMALQSDGKPVLAGRSGFGNTSNALLLRYNTDGTPDLSFSGDGQLIITAYSSEDQLNAVDILDDGAIVGAGYADIIGDMKTMLVKVDVNGVPVTSFGGDGVIIPSLGATADQVWAIEAKGQEFFVTGVHMDVMSDYDTYIAKFTDGGAFVSGFGSGGVTVTNTNVNETGFDIAVQGDGKVLVGGTSGQFGFGSARDFMVIRYDGAGIVDPAFGNNGVVITSIQNDFDDVNGLDIQPDGKIVAAGFTSGFSLGTNNDLAVVRYLNDGTVDVASIPADVNTSFAFPVPAHGSVSIRSAVAFDAVQVTDALGAVVLSEHIPATRTISLQLQRTGMLFYTLFRSGTPIGAGRFVTE